MSNRSSTAVSSQNNRYNMVVVGAGAAGLVSAYIAATVRARVALIEREKMGGDCLNTGCVPSKAIIRTAKFVHDMRRCQELGIKSVNFDFDFSEVMDRVHEVITKIEPHDSVERYTGLGVECFSGNAEFIDSHHVKVGDQTLRAKNIVLAMGAEPLVPPIPGLSEINARTSDNLWQMRTLPKRFAILGGGPIGCEMVQAFQRLGSQVIQIEMADRILPREDPEVAELIQKTFAEEGVDVRVGTKATKFEKNGDEIKITVEIDGRSESITCDEVFVAVGRKARTKNQGLERLGIELNPNGTVKVDDYLRTTTHKHIYACGDVAGPYQFTHTAAHMAWFCAVNALFSPLKKFKVDYRVISWCTFTDPEVAQVGLNETAAKAKNIPYEVHRYDVDDLDRAIAESETKGFVKVLVKPGTDKVIGCTIVSHLAGELISEFVSAMKHGFGLNKILGTIHAYPTFVEANKYTAGVWKKSKAPQGILNMLEKVHAMRR